MQVGPFEQFVRTHASSLMRTAFLLAGDQHAAEDLVQSTLTHLYPRWDQVTSADSQIAYVRRSLVNRFLGERRRASARDLVVSEVPDRPDHRDMADMVAASDEMQTLLNMLPARQRTAVVLRYYHDAPDEQIAQLLGCREATVRSLLHRALRTLRDGHTTEPMTGTEGSI